MPRKLAIVRAESGHACTSPSLQGTLTAQPGHPGLSWQCVGLCRAAWTRRPWRGDSCMHVGRGQQDGLESSCKENPGCLGAESLLLMLSLRTWGHPAQEETALRAYHSLKSRLC